jgi:hypothetical protein
MRNLFQRGDIRFASRTYADVTRVQDQLALLGDFAALRRAARSMPSAAAPMPSAADVGHEAPPSQGAYR